MAWQAYVDNLIATGHVDKAAVFGHNGCAFPLDVSHSKNRAKINPPHLYSFPLKSIYLSIRARVARHLLSVWLNLI
jgi:hypothetical protein